MNEPIDDSVELIDDSDSMQPADSPHGTTMPRHISAILDNSLSLVVSVVAAKQLPESMPVAQVAVLCTSYLAYYFVFEAILCSTPGKLVNGLVVRDFHGGRCSLKQTVVRTLFRLIEVNPALFGGLPAAARIVWSQHKQRFGDRVAGTVVVFR